MSEFFHPRTLPGPLLAVILTILATFLSSLSPFHQKLHFSPVKTQKIRCILTLFFGLFYGPIFCEFTGLFCTFLPLFDLYPPPPPPPASENREDLGRGGGGGGEGGVV